MCGARYRLPGLLTHQSRVCSHRATLPCPERFVCLFCYLNVISLSDRSVCSLLCCRHFCITSSERACSWVTAVLSSFTCSVLSHGYDSYDCKKKIITRPICLFTYYTNVSLVFIRVRRGRYVVCLRHVVVLQPSLAWSSLYSPCWL